MTRSPDDPGGAPDGQAPAAQLAALAGRAQELQARVDELEAARDAPDPELDALRARVRRIDESILWRAGQRMKRTVYGPAGDRSRRARAISSALRGMARVADRSRPAGESASATPTAPQAPPAIAEIPWFADPQVSLILPVHSQPELAAACVRAIVATATVPYELIVVDDTATAAVKELTRRIPGATVIVNEENLGYTGSLNRGAALARGRFLVLLNDDTVPQAGWLEAMVGCAESAPDVGIVVPMYLDTDGSLKEAGSIVWHDGSAQNFGRGDADTGRSRYRHRREVDYGSGACLLIRAELFRAVGGLDECFAPAYYEDVDLCFAAREAGSRVLYEPTARVIHVEGASNGTDTSTGPKRFQLVNQGLFVDKWRHRLAEQPRRGGEPKLASRRAQGPHVLIADEQIPRPDRDGGSRRMRGLIDAFGDLGCTVTLLPANGEAPEPYTTQLEAAGIEVLRSPADVAAELPVIGPTLALGVLSRPFVASRFIYPLRTFAPAARIAYDTVDLHFVRELRHAAVEDVPAGERVTAVREIELAMVRSCDVTIVVTDEEREELLRSAPGADVRVIPAIEEPVPGIAGPEGRSGIVFVGNFRHPPNVDAARFLVAAVMPHVWRELGDVRLTLVGQDPPPEVQALAGARVEVAGWVEHLGPVLAGARVAAAPLRFGAGLKLKTVEAMAHGVPVVTTAVGAEGMLAPEGEHLLVADEPHELAARLIAVLRDDALWQRTSDAGVAFVRERYAPAVILPQLRELLPAWTATAPVPLPAT